MIATRCRFSSVLTAHGIYATSPPAAETDLAGSAHTRHSGADESLEIVMAPAWAEPDFERE